MRTLKDKEKVLYAPFSNIGALNFEKTTGYITIPDKQVIYTRVDEEEDGGDAPTGNEGQKMMWNLQDLDDQIDAEKIEAPELLAGFDVVLEEKGRNADFTTLVKKILRASRNPQMPLRHMKKRGSRYFSVSAKSTT